MTNKHCSKQILKNLPYEGEIKIFLKIIKITSKQLPNSFSLNFREKEGIKKDRMDERGKNKNKRRWKTKQARLGGGGGGR